MASCFKTNISKDNYAFINQHEEAFFQHKNDMDCVAKHPCRLMEKIVRQDKKNGWLFFYLKTFSYLKISLLQLRSSFDK